MTNPDDSALYIGIWTKYAVKSTATVLQDKERTEECLPSPCSRTLIRLPGPQVKCARTTRCESERPGLPMYEGGGT